MIYSLGEYTFINFYYMPWPTNHVFGLSISTIFPLKEHNFLYNVLKVSFKCVFDINAPKIYQGKYFMYLFVQIIKNCTKKYWHVGRES